MHEASQHEENCFITLTYDENNIPENGSLNVAHFQKFMKRLRKDSTEKIRFFHCGEYGEKLGRPHYHACIFGKDFTDTENYLQGESKISSSKKLSILWPFGYNVVGTLTFESAAYVARYITKKITGQLAEKHYEKINNNTGEVIDKKPEYVTMSRRPGIGKKWFDKFYKEVYQTDSVIVKAKEMLPPKYYDRQYEIIQPEKMEKVKRDRILVDEKVEKNRTPERLKEREICAQAKQKNITRRFENGTISNGNI